MPHKGSLFDQADVKSNEMKKRTTMVSNNVAIFAGRNIPLLLIGIPFKATPNKVYTKLGDSDK